MRPYMLGLAALVCWAGCELPASAAWNNVFQPTLFGRLRRPTTTNYYYGPPVVANYAPPVVANYAPAVSYSAPVAASPSPCSTGSCGQQCTTQYTQRSYYQPVTTYRTETAYEPVTTYRTSYYQEPVTSYRYSCYYDPCTCSYQQVATPVTSYQLREQKCPVQSWVARCYQVPVTTYQQRSYWEPQTTCCSTTVGAPIFQGAAPTAPPVPAAPPRPPIVEGSQGATAPSISSETRSPSYYGPMYERHYPPITPNSIQTPAAPSAPPPIMPPVTSTPRTAPQPPAPVRLEGIAFGPDAQVEGQVVRNDQSPRANAKVMFVNAQTGSRQTINANSAGRFHVELTGGSWLVYLYGADELPTLADRFELFGRQSAPLRLVSR